MMARAWWVMVFVGVGCTPVEPAPLQLPALEPELAGPPLPESLPTLSFRSVRFAEAGITLDVIDAPLHTHAWEQGGVLSQTVPVADDLAIRIVVRAGRGETLAAVRREHQAGDAAFSLVRRDRVCGQASRKLEIREPEAFIECIEYADGRPSEPGYIPAQTTIVHAFGHGGLDVTVRWEVPRELREHYRADEEHFFAGLRCEEGR